MNRFVLGLLTCTMMGCPPVKVADGTVDSGAPATPDACDGSPDRVICEEGVALSCDGQANVSAEQACEAGMEQCYDGVGCLSCAVGLDVTLSDDAAETGLGVYLAVDAAPLGAEGFAVAQLDNRALIVSTAEPLPSGTVTLSADSAGVELYDESGGLLSLPAALDAASLPVTVYLRAVARGTTTLTASTDGCEATDAVILRAGTRPSLSGRAATLPPYWASADSFNDVEAVTVALDPARYADRVGLSYDLYVVDHKAPEAWAADPSLVDVSGAVETATVSADGLTANILTAWDSPDAGEGVIGAAYDLVLDFGRDGRLDPGDLIDGLREDGGGAFVLGDLSEPGPHEVVSLDYDSELMWRDQRIYYPADVADLGELPLVVISHGNGHDYTWYDYLGEHLASWGYILMAHQNNTGPGIETASTTTIQNTDAFLLNLDSIADGALSGHVNSHQIVWIGHSRGGEGVVRAIDRLVEGDATVGAYTPADIVLISSIAPTVFNSVTDSDPHDWPYHLIAGASDGDVTGGADCSQCQFFRLSQAALGPVQTTYVQGAGHNDFNCCGFDDATGPDQLGRDEVQVIAKSYLLALIETYVADNPATAELITGMSTGFRPSGIGAADVIASTYRDAHALGYPIFDDYQSELDVDLSSSGGAVTATVSELVEDSLSDGDGSFTWRDSDPMNAMTQAVDADDLARGAVFEWAEGEEASVQIEVPATLADWTDYAVISLVAAQGSRHPNTEALAGPLDFTVVLLDATGVESGINFRDHGQITAPYQRSGVGSGRGWADELNTVRIPLTDFEVGSDINLSEIVAIRLDFGGAYGSPTGRLALDNVELSR